MPDITTIRVILPKPNVVRIVVGGSSQITPSIGGLRLRYVAIGSNFNFTTSYFGYLVDASGGGVTGSLPAATGSGQIYRTKKLDSTSNVVTIAANGTDLIDDSVSINLVDQWSDCVISDAAPGYWDAWILGSGGGINPLTDTPTDLNEVIDGGSTLGFWP